MPVHKPTKWTKREWQDHRSMMAKGSGVGKALDDWQKHCPHDLKGLKAMDAAKLKRAVQCAHNLKKSLGVAKGKLNAKLHAETLGMIKHYEDGVDRYLNILKIVNQRLKVKPPANFKEVLANKEISAAFADFAKKERFFFEVLHTALLLRVNGLREAVKKYSKDNDYNVDGEINTTLRRAFGLEAGEKPSANEIKAATTALKDNVERMLSDRKHYSGFATSKAWAAYLDKKFPLKPFTP